MISWGSKSDIQGEFSETHEEVCKVCQQKNKPTYLVEQLVFMLYLMPVFPTKRIVSKICSNCQFKSKVRIQHASLDSDPNLYLVNNKFPKVRKIEYYWGLFVFAAILGSLATFLVFMFA